MEENTSLIPTSLTSLWRPSTLTFSTRLHAVWSHLWPHTSWSVLMASVPAKPPWLHVLRLARASQQHEASSTRGKRCFPHQRR